jgi:hypothetical protein
MQFVNPRDSIELTSDSLVEGSSCLPGRQAIGMGKPSVRLFLCFGSVERARGERGDHSSSSSSFVIFSGESGCFPNGGT